MEQEGQFRNTGTSWVPFHAHQLLSNSGFVWDATISLMPYPWSPTMQVCDAWAGGQATMKVALMRVIGLGSQQTSDEEENTSMMLLQGEALRWLAEAVLIPTALRPEEGLVLWNKSEREDMAILSLNPNAFKLEAQLEVTFDVDGFLVQVNGRRPFWNSESNKFLMKSWEGHLFNYQEQEHPNGWWVPQRMACGWYLDDDDDEQTQNKLELYFQGMNRILNYTMATERDDFLEMEEDATTTTPE
jgi:hypothetical protein